MLQWSQLPDLNPTEHFYAFVYVYYTHTHTLIYISSVFRSFQKHMTQVRVEVQRLSCLMYKALTDLLKLLALKTDKMSEEKFEASGIIP